MRRSIYALLAATVVAAIPLSAQNAAPALNFDSAPNPLTLPDDIYLGEVGGVATNSRGDIFVYTRTGHPTVSMATARPFVHGGSRLFQFDRNGKFTREIGQGVYGFLFAAQVRVDPQDNIWVVDEMSAMVMKFDPQGRVAFLLGRKAEAIQNPPRAGGPGGGGGEGGGGRGGGAPGAGAQQDLFNRPTDVAWDAQGNIFVADGRGNARVAKFSKDGVFVKSWGQKGTAPGQFASVDSIAVDAQGNVYAADGGNMRIQVFDNNGTFKTEIKNVGNAQAICITPGANQVHVRLEFQSAERPRHGRRNLQDAPRRIDDWQVRQGRQTAEGVRHRQRDRLPQREHAVCRRSRQFQGAEAHDPLITRVRRWADDVGLHASVDPHPRDRDCRDAGVRPVVLRASQRRRGATAGRARRKRSSRSCRPSATSPSR